MILDALFIDPEHVLHVNSHTIFKMGNVRLTDAVPTTEDPVQLVLLLTNYRMESVKSIIAKNQEMDFVKFANLVSIFTMEHV